MLATNRNDEYIRELQDDKGEAILEVELIGGISLYGDDNRPNLEEPSFWKRLISKRSLPTMPAIERIFIKFRTERVEPFSAYEKPKGFFFIKSMVKHCGGGSAAHFFNLGRVVDDKIVVRTYRVPDLTFMSESERPLAGNEDLVLWT
jgi:hypothetical protein